MSMQALREHCVAAGVVTNEAEFRTRFEDKVKEIMRLLFLQVKPQLDRKQGTFELFGFDFLVDEALNPYLIEINVNPALFTDTSVQKELLPRLVDETVGIALRLHPEGKMHSKAEVKEYTEALKAGDEASLFEMIYCEEDA